jgi:hypothetical protein
MPGAERAPAVPREGHSRSLKTKHHKSGSALSLKRWVREQRDDETKIQAEDWHHNKRANFARPPLGIGNTKSRKGSNKAPPPTPDKKRG